METLNTPNTGNYLAIAGLVSSIASHYGYTVTTDSVLTVIGAVLIIWGLIKQQIDHKKTVNIALETPVNSTNQQI